MKWPKWLGRHGHQCSRERMHDPIQFRSATAAPAPGRTSSAQSWPSSKTNWLEVASGAVPPCYAIEALVQIVTTIYRPAGQTVRASVHVLHCLLACMGVKERRPTSEVPQADSRSPQKRRNEQCGSAHRHMHETHYYNYKFCETLKNSL